jgi:transglutaminase-like putative cysteine protease
MRYRFDRPVNLGPHVIRLRPAPHCRTPLRAYTLQVEPAGHVVEWLRDPFGNYLARLTYTRPVTDLTVDIALMIEMGAIEPFNLTAEPSACHYPFEYAAHLRNALAPYLEITESGPLLRKWLQRMHDWPRATADFLAAVNRRVQQDVGYCVRMQPGVQSCEQTLQLQSGSCRDSAWLLVQILRHMGLAARFVSGYLLQPAPDQSPNIEDCVELHAWTEVYIPGAGWIGLDSTSGLFTAAGHIPLACAPEPLAATPVSGTTGKCAVMLEFYSKATRLPISAPEDEKLPGLN